MCASFGIHREMHQCTLGEHEDRLARVAVVAVLVDGVGGGLAAERVLQPSVTSGMPFTDSTTSSDFSDFGLKCSWR